MFKYSETHRLDEEHCIALFVNSKDEWYGNVIKLPPQTGAGKSLFDTPAYKSINDVKEYVLSKISLK